MRNHARRVAGIVLLAATAALTAAWTPAQRDVSLETLVGALEGRLGVHARNLRTGQELAIYSDSSHPVGALRLLLGADSRLSAAPATDNANATLPSVAWDHVVAALSTDDLAVERLAWSGLGATGLTIRTSAADPQSTVNLDSPLDGPARPMATARVLAQAVERLRGAFMRDPAHPLRRAMIEVDRKWFGALVSPAFETGAALTAVPGTAGAAGWVSTPKGDLVIAALSHGFEDGAAAASLLPVIVEACVRRIASGSTEPAREPDADRTAGLILASLHEARSDAELFASAPSDLDAAATARRARHRLTFKPGETIRLAILARVPTPTRVAVQWILPDGAGRAPSPQRLIAPTTGTDLTFDLPVLSPGSYRVRCSFADRIALDETIYVTAK